MTRGGEPVAGARVELGRAADDAWIALQRGSLQRVSWIDAWRTESDADGRFVALLPHAGPWFLRASARGAAATVVELEGYDPAAGIDGLALELDAFAELEGSVRTRSGKPLAGKTVVASHALHAGRIARVDDEGRYRFRRIEPGDWYLQVEDEVEAYSGTELVQVDADWELPASVTLASGETRVLAIVLPDPEELVVRGTVRLGGARAEGLRVALSRARGRDPLRGGFRREVAVGADGAFELELPWEGAFRASIEAESIGGALSRQLELHGGPFQVDLELRLSPVRLRSRTAPPPDAEVELLLSGELDGWTFAARRPLPPDGDAGTFLLPPGVLEIERRTTRAGERTSERFSLPVQPLLELP